MGWDIYLDIYARISFEGFCEAYHDFYMRKIDTNTDKIDLYTMMKQTYRHLPIKKLTEGLSIQILKQGKIDIISYPEDLLMNFYNVDIDKQYVQRQSRS